MESATRRRLLSLGSVVGFCVPVVVLVLCTLAAQTVARRFPEHDAGVYLTAAGLGLLVMGEDCWRSREMTGVSYLALFFSGWMLIIGFDPPFWLIMVVALIVGPALGVVQFFLPERGAAEASGPGGGVP